MSWRWVTTAVLEGDSDRPYHLKGPERMHGGQRLLLTLCGCAIRWDDEYVMVRVATSVAALISRPCKDCVRRARLMGLGPVEP